MKQTDNNMTLNARRTMLSGVATAVVSLVVLVVGFAFTVTPAHAQSSSFSTSSLPRLNMPSDFPFGYGGGPRMPTLPDTSGIISRAFSRINAIFNRLFNR